MVTVFVPRAMPVYVFAALSKASRETFTDAEVNAMAGLAKRILAGLK